MRALFLIAILLASGLGPMAPIPARAAEEMGGGRYLMVLARDGAFGGRLWSLAGRTIALDAEEPGAAALFTQLTDAHGWSAADRADWRTLPLGDGVQALCDGRAAAIVTLARPDEPRLDLLPAGCLLRMVDLGDNVTRGFAAASELQPVLLPGGQHPAIALGATTLKERPAVQIADRP